MGLSGIVCGNLTPAGFRSPRREERKNATGMLQDALAPKERTPWPMKSKVE
jgi:hypothetical protein